MLPIQNEDPNVDPNVDPNAVPMDVDPNVDPNVQNLPELPLPASVNAVNPADVDEFGVPWRNRAMESTRKLEELRDKFMNYPVAPPPEEDDFTRSTREVAERVLDDRNRQEREADVISENALNSIISVNPSVGPLKSAIMRDLKLLSSDLRRNPKIVENVTYTVLGRMTFNAKHTPVARTVAGNSTPGVLPPSKGGSANINTEITLTSGETEYANYHDLEGKGFGKNEIRDMYNKRNKKK